jgi:hypothetical protein
MADTHDRLPLLDKAIQCLNEERVELVLHAGDYIAPFVVPHYKPLKASLIGVFGNNDAEREALRKRFAAIGGEIRGKFAEISVDKIKIALLHGEEEELLRSLIETEGYDVVIYGHTHEADIHRKGRTLVINPGEICGYLTGHSTLSVLDTQKLDVRTISLV